VAEPELAGTIRQRQDLERQLSALRYRIHDLETFAGSRDRERVTETLQAQIDRVRSALRTLDAEIHRRFPKYAELTNPPPLSAAEAQRLLTPGEALISVFVGHERSYVWAVPSAGPVRVAVVPLHSGAVETLVNRVRATVESGARTIGEIPAFDLGAASALHEAFLEPVVAAWRDARELLIVPHGALGRLPFSVLPTRPVNLAAEQEPLFGRYREVPWLIREHAVTVLPSVASLKALRQLKLGDPARHPFVGFADPYFNPAQAAAAEAAAAIRDDRPALRGHQLQSRAPVETRQLDSARLAQLPRLPDTAEEVRQIARALGADPAAVVFVGSQATEQRVKTMDLAAYRVLTFATHGLVPGDLDGLLEPGLALSAPSVVGGEEDGLLTAGEVLGLRLNADWVVLSACNTAAAGGAGAEALSGLGRAFFYAGARALLVSHWPVETTSARVLTTDLFRRQRGGVAPRAQALQETLNWMIDTAGFVDPRTRQLLFSYAHPRFWAPFALVGEGG
jgi:CHAT domain-containing protein